jgi:hypothetical protein
MARTFRGSSLVASPLERRDSDPLRSGWSRERKAKRRAHAHAPPFCAIRFAKKSAPRQIKPYAEILRHSSAVALHDSAQALHSG